MKLSSFYILLALILGFLHPVFSQLDTLSQQGQTMQESILSKDYDGQHDETTIEKNISSETSGNIDQVQKPKPAEDLFHAPDVRNLISFNKVFWAAIFLVLGYFLIRGISFVLKAIIQKHPKSKSLIRRLIPVVRIAGWSLIIYIIISGIIQPPRETIFAFFASIGVAVGFASQDLLKNVFGGLMIMFDKPFQVGDKIEVGKYYGEVIEIGLRSTRIVTPDDSIVTVPNSDMVTQSVSNANSGENNCQVVAEIFLPVDIDTRRVRQIATETAQVSKYIYLNKPIAVEFLNEVNPRGSYLKMRLKAYVLDVTHEFPFQSEMTEIVIREILKEGLMTREGHSALLA